MFHAFFFMNSDIYVIRKDQSQPLADSGTGIIFCLWPLKASSMAMASVRKCTINFGSFSSKSFQTPKI